MMKQIAKVAKRKNPSCRLCKLFFLERDEIWLSWANTLFHPSCYFEYCRKLGVSNPVPKMKGLHLLDVLIAGRLADAKTLEEEVRHD